MVHSMTNGAVDPSGDTAVLAVLEDPARLAATADPAQYVTTACERAKEWLAQALAHGDLDQIVELKSRAEAVRIYSTQKQLGKDAELAAAEIVRRAERGIGLAVRQGQADGWIKTRGDGGWKARKLDPLDEKKKSPEEYFRGAGGAQTDAYTMADTVSDEEFDAAIEQGKVEGNLSRANVVRKIEGGRPSGRVELRARIVDLAGRDYTSRQIAGQLGVTFERVRDIARTDGIQVPADQVVGRTRRLDPERIIRETVTGLEGLCLGVDHLEPHHFDQLDPAVAHEWATALAASLRRLHRLRKDLHDV